MQARRAAAALAVATALPAVAACTSSAGIDPADVPSVSIDFDVIQGTDGVDEPIVLGDVLIARRVHDTRPGGRALDLVSSRDLGRSWDVVDLPGRPEIIDRIHIRRIETGLAVSAEKPFRFPRDTAGDAFLWVSSDGLDWQGGPIPVPAGDAGVSRVWNRADGSLVARIDPYGDAPFYHLQSTDGVSWKPSECPDERNLPPECRDVQRHGDLWVRGGDELSDDAGQSWFAPEVESVREDRITDFSLVERDDGGWLAVVTMWNADSTDTWDDRFLVRSDDGRQWEVIFEHDSRCGADFPGEWISTPVRLGERWLVAYTCDNPRKGLPGPRLSRLYLLNADGTELLAVDGTAESDYRYGQPIAVDGGVMVAAEPFRTGGIEELRLFRS